MKTRLHPKLMITLAGTALAIVALAGCSSMPASTSSDTSSSSSAGSGYGGAPTPSASDSGSGSGTVASGDAAVASTSIGDVVVDGKGMTAYYYDMDTPNSGASACTGECAGLWPAIESSSTTPQVSGITGTVATIKGVDGGNQITINGRPIYTYASDTAPGDVNGQGVLGIWYVVSPAGDELKTAK